MTDDSAAWRGRVIDDRYVVDEVIGRGAMGVVVRAQHRFTGATVALKVLRDEFAADPDLQRRFLAEARAGNAIAHPGIVQVLDAGRDAQTGALYLTMEFVAGESLRDPLVRGAMPPVQARRIGLKLADALGAAHARGFVHRDMKPENVLLATPTGAVKVLDFGIAKVLAQKPSTLGATAVGVLLGTVAYMAPEQLEDARAVDARADLWAIGVMLFEMFSGRLPWDAYTPQALFVAVATEEPTPIRKAMPTAPLEYDAFFARALARDPARRFGSAAELAAALAALPLGGGGVPAVSALPTVRTRPEPTSSRGGLWLGAAVAAAILGVIGAYLATRPPDAPVSAGSAVAVIAPVPDAAVVAVVVPPPPQQPPPDAAAAIAAPPPDAAAAPAIAVAPPADAAVRTPTPPPPADAAVRTPTPPPPADAAVRTPTPPPAADACTTGCAQLTNCGLPAAGCAAACAQRPDVAKCLADAGPACAHLGACALLVDCGVAPAGSATCMTLAIAHSRCAPAQRDCRCGDVRTLSPAAANALATLNACAAHCQDGACTARDCASPAALCMAQ